MSSKKFLIMTMLVIISLCLMPIVDAILLVQKEYWELKQEKKDQGINFDIPLHEYMTMKRTITILSPEALSDAKYLLETALISPEYDTDLYQDVYQFDWLLQKDSDDKWSKVPIDKYYQRPNDQTITITTKNGISQEGVYYITRIKSRLLE